jgi:outer membrane protein OmpA-like peptidoglycan-associated protein
MLPTCVRPNLFFIFALLLLALSGCQTTAPRKGLQPAQIVVLQQQGFVLNDEGWELGMSSKVLFGNDIDTLTADSIANIERIGYALLGADIQKLRLEGHTDSYGDPTYNQDLSVRRANSVAQVLIGIGMHPENVSVRGLGMSKPVADNKTASGRMENRRVSIIIPAE